MIPDHLQPKRSERGLAHMPELRSPHRDDVVTAYESSNAMGPHVRLCIDERDGDAAQIELSAENAWRLAEQLMALVACHYQGDARPQERYADLTQETKEP